MFDVCSIIGIFTVIDGEICILLNNKKLIELSCLDDINIINSNYINKNFITDKINLKQCYTFSEKENDKLRLKVLYIDVVNYSEFTLNNNYKFYKVSEFIDNIYLLKMLEYVKKEFMEYNTLRKIYNEEFVLPDIQKLYESILNKKYDRRNFRKKLIKSGVVEDLNKLSTNKTGRPAKLYKFKELNSFNLGG